jgi:predicted ATPase
VEEYLGQRFGRNAALTELSRMIYHRTDGNALFMVSFVDSLLQQELIAETENQLEIRAALPTLQKFVPNNLQQTILRQIERLQMDEQQLLGIASVGGRTFTAAEIAELIGRPLEDVEEVCDELAARERLITAVGIMEWPDGTVTAQYEFRHALYQQVAYEQLGQARRIRLHRSMGKRKEAEYGDRVAEIAAELAMHFTEGRDYSRAAQYYCQAGEAALRRNAYRETLDHCEKGLELLKRLSDTPTRQQQELALLMTLGVTLTATKGYAAAEVEQTYLRARTLCEREGKTSHLFSVLYGLWNCYTTRGELQTAYTLAEQLLDIAQRADDSTLRLMAHWVMGRAQYWYGRLLSAREHLEQILTLYNPTEHGALVIRYSQDVQLTVPSFVAVALWLLGYPDQARCRIEQALAQESDLPSSFSLAHALTNAALVHQFCGEILRTQERAETTITFATEYGFPHWVNWGTALRGWALAAQGQGEVGISLLRQSLAALAASGVRLARPYILSLLGNVYQRMGQAEDGLNAIAEALTQVQDSGERYCEAELYRLKGELTLQQERQKVKIKRQKAKMTNPQTEAEACFLQAIAIAQQQEAKSLELRATMSLARLWQQRGKHHEARTTLSAIYDWFTEGFDTEDLREAKALLDTLRR